MAHRSRTYCYIGNWGIQECMYDTVIVPTDGSDVSIAAVREAIELTESAGTIHVLAVVEELPLYKQSGTGAKLPEADKTSEHDLLEEASREIEDLVVTAGLECELATTEGVPFREIISYAEEMDADAIVMGKRGRGAAANDMLGSTSERVVHRAKTSVVTVPDS